MLITINSIDIYLLYYSSTGRDSSLFDIVNKNAWLEEKDLRPENYWNTGGGLQIIVDGYLTLFRSTDFHYLLKVTSFLIESMYMIHNQGNDWFNNDWFNSVKELAVTLKTTADNSLVLVKNENIVMLSYYSGSHLTNNRRGNQFFENIEIDSRCWIAACNVALNEYFDTMRNLINLEQDEATSNLMLSYEKIFRGIEGK